MQKKNYIIISIIGLSFSFSTNNPNLSEIKDKIITSITDLKETIELKFNNRKKKTAAQLLGNQLLKYSNNNYPYAEQIAKVRTGEELCAQEQAFLKKRKAFIQKKLSKLFLRKHIPEHAVPSIAICGSGGSYRAMTATLGSLVGADQWGLLDVTTYLAGVSGSTWAISGLMASDLTPEAYLKQLLPRLSLPLQNGFNSSHLKEALLRKTLFDQPIGIIDLFGNLVAQKILPGLAGKQNANDFYLHDCPTKIELGELPLPIYTSLIAQKDEYIGWMEYTPFEVGSRDLLKSFIPTWAFGREFKRGISTNNPPPPALSLGLGIWGSAMNANISEMLKLSKKLQPKTIQRFTKNLRHMPFTKIIQKIRIINPTKVPNWNYHLNKHELQYKKNLSVIDSGVFINIPVPSFLGFGRTADIIIVLDNSLTAGSGNQLKKIIEYAQKYHLKLPPIDLTKTKEIISVHSNNDDPECPVIIYLPLVANPKYTQGWNPSPLEKETFTKSSNFGYTPEQVQQLAGLTTLNISQKTSKEAILNALRFKINQKAPRTV